MTPEAGAALGVALRWAQYAALLLLVGGGVLRFGVLPRLAAAVGADALPNLVQRARGFVLAAATLLLAATGLKVVPQAATFLEPGEALTADLVRRVIGTAWGGAWQLQLAAAVLAACGAIVAWRRERLGAQFTALGAWLAAWMIPLGGHAATEAAIPRVGVAVQALHVLGAGVWLGTLAAIVMVVVRPRGLPADRRDAGIAAAIARFSPLALAGATFVLLPGAAMNLHYLGAPADLWTTAWGRAMLLKLAAVGGVLLLGAYNWRRMTPLLGTPAATARFGRSAAAELALALAALLATAALVTRPLPAEAAHMGEMEAEVEATE